MSWLLDRLAPSSPHVEPRSPAIMKSLSMLAVLGVALYNALAVLAVGLNTDPYRASQTMANILDLENGTQGLRYPTDLTRNLVPVSRPRSTASTCLTLPEIPPLPQRLLARHPLLLRCALSPTLLSSAPL